MSVSRRRQGTCAKSHPLTSESRQTRDQKTMASSPLTYHRLLGLVSGNRRGKRAKWHLFSEIRIDLRSSRTLIVTPHFANSQYRCHVISCEIGTYRGECISIRCIIIMAISGCQLGSNVSVCRPAMQPANAGLSPVCLLSRN